MIIVCWIVFSFAIAIFANRYGRSDVGYFLLSLVLSPLLTGILLLALGKTPKAKAREMVRLRKELEAIEKAL